MHNNRIDIILNEYDEMVFRTIFLLVKKESNEKRLAENKFVENKDILNKLSELGVEEEQIKESKMKTSLKILNGKNLLVYNENYDFIDSVCISTTDIGLEFYKALLEKDEQQKQAEILAANSNFREQTEKDFEQVKASDISKNNIAKSDIVNLEVSANIPKTTVTNEPKLRAQKPIKVRLKAFIWGLIGGILGGALSCVGVYYLLNYVLNL